MDTRSPILKSARIRYEIPKLVGIDHFNKDVAGEKFALHDLLFSVRFFLDRLLGGNLNVGDLVGEIVVLDEPHKALLDHRLVTRISVKNIPLRLLVLRHITFLPTKSGI